MKNIFFISIFLIVFLSIVLGVHYFVYFSLLRFFKIQSTWIKISLALSFVLLPISFIGVSALTNYFHNTFVNWSYMISGLWLGVITTLFGFFIIAWGLYGLFVLFNLNVDLKILGLLVLVITFFYSIYFSILAA